jgi:hypothetical protein
MPSVLDARFLEGIPPFATLVAWLIRTHFILLQNSRPPCVLLLVTAWGAGGTSVHRQWGAGQHCVHQRATEAARAELQGSCQTGSDLPSAKMAPKQLEGLPRTSTENIKAWFRSEFNNAEKLQTHLVGESA